MTYAADFSDNNGEVDVAHVAKHGPIDLCILKLYPTGWTERAYNRLKGTYAIGFYAAETTPTWADAESVILGLGLDPKQHPFSFDLFEFGFDDTHVKAEIAKAQAAGMKVGNYRSASSYQQLGADWRWVADTRYPPGKTPVKNDLHQYQAIKGWGDKSYTATSLTDFLAKTTTGGDMALSDADLKQVAVAEGYSDMGSAKEQNDISKAINDVIMSKKKRTGQSSEYDTAFDNATAALARAGIPAGTTFEATTK